MQKGLLPYKRVKGKRPLVFDIGTNKKSKDFPRVINLARAKEAFSSLALPPRNKKQSLGKQEKPFLKWKASLVLAIIFYLAVGIGFVSLLHKSLIAQEGKTAWVNFYAAYSEISGEPQGGEGWLSIDKALGEEDIGRSGDIDFFSSENSAVYRGGDHSLILSEFITREYIKVSYDEEDEEKFEEGGGASEPEEDEPEEESEEEENIASSSTDIEEEPGSEDEEEEGEEEGSSEGEEEEPTEETSEEEETKSDEEDEEEILGEDEPIEEESEESLEEEPVFEEEVPAEEEIIETEEEEMDETSEEDGEEEEISEEISFLESFRNIFAFSKERMGKYFSIPRVLAEWGAEADDRNIIFGEFRNANIKISLAAIEKLIDESLPKDEEEEIVEEEPGEEEGEEETVLPPEEEENNPFEDPEEENVFAEEEESQGDEEIFAEENISEEDEQILEEEEESGFFDRVLDFFAPGEATAGEEDPKIIIWYSFANENFESPWKQLAKINYSYFSNFTNKGYLSLEASFLNDWRDIDDLRLKFEGQAQGSSFTVYLDSAWVEAEYIIVEEKEEEEEKKEEGEGDKDVLIIDGKKIVFQHTDNNDNENLIIRSNEKDYVGLLEAEVYFSIENIGTRDEEIDVHFYFPSSKGEITKVEKLHKNKPYLTEVPKYDSQVYGCDNGWDKREEFYLCYPTGEKRACDLVSPNKRYCRIEKVRLGMEKKVKYRHAWEDMKLTDRFIPDERNFFKRLLGLGPQNKPVPEAFKREISTDESGVIVAPGEVQYFKATISFPPNSKGEFYIETIGHADGYGLLDPWWSSSWNYRMPITIDNSSNVSTLTDYQIYVEIPTSTSDFWNNVKSDGSDVRFVNSTETQELDFWTQHFDSTASSASFWVQVDSVTGATTTDIFVYYGNAGATSTSNAYTPFSYSSMQDLFYVVASHTSMTVEVVSLIDSNEVQLDSQTSVSLDRQDTTSFSSAVATSTFRAKGPVGVRVGSINGGNVLVPVSFLSTGLVVPSVRNDEKLNIYSKFFAADVTTYDGTTQNGQKFLSLGEHWSTSSPVSAGKTAIVEATNPIMLYSYNLNGATIQDSISVYPPTTRDLYGVRSDNNYIGAISTSSFNIYCSDLSSTTVSSLAKGTLYTNTTCTNGSEGTGNAVRLEGATNGLASIQQEDSDGSESTIFLPFKEFSSEYMLPTNAAYLAIVCAPKTGTVTIEVYNESNVLASTTSCVPSGDYPGKAYLGDADTTKFNAGSRIIASNTKSFYMYYEDTEAAAVGDETNIWGPVQARKYSSPHPGYSLGEHEILGAPTGTINSAVQKNNGSGRVDISIEVDDISNDDCRAKIEYATGTSCVFGSPADPTLDEASANISADFGVPVIENDNTYQVGTTSGWIKTDSGSNTVHFDWLTKNDLPSADGDYCIRLTVNDTLEDQATSATTTLTIDNTNPTAPGSLFLSSRTGASITLTLGATSTETNFKEYIVYYKVYDGFPVTEGDSPHSSSSDANLASTTFNGATTTTVNGLSAGTTYTFDIWAYDDYGNKASSTSGIDIEANDAPTGSFNTISQDTDGSGRVSISIEVDDNNNDNEVRAKIEYATGTSCDFSSPADPTIDEASTSISADFGIVVADDDETYQVGSSTGWILTAPGSNTVQFDWLSATDLPNATGTYCLRLTTNDGLDDQATSDTATVTIDNLAPTATGDLTEGTVGFTSIQLIFATTTPATDENEPSTDAYKIFYEVGTSSVTQGGTEHDDANLDAYDYSSATSTTVSGLTAGTNYVFNIWAYDTLGNSTGATEITIQTDSNLVNKSLTFTNPQSSGTTTNIVLADTSTKWNFQAVVNDVGGWGTIDEVYLRLANINDNTTPFDDLKFKWIEASDTFSEVGTDTNSMASVSASSSSSCSGNSCTLDFKIIFNKTFATTSVNYDVELYSIDDLSRTDEDTYSNFYQVRKTWLDQIHYRWRNDDGGG